jgi:Domain of unknown function (DUF1707)
MVTPASGHGRLRASHADREQVVDALKAAFVQGRLTQDELDTRVGHALAARTYAELAALTADLPTEPDRAPAPAHTQAPVPARTRPHHRPVKVGAGVIGAVIVATSGAAAATREPLAAVALPIFLTLLTAIATSFVAVLIAVTLKAESIHRNRSRRQLPPGPASGTDGPASPGPPGGPPQARPAAGPPGPRTRRPHGLLAVGRARAAGSPALPRGGRTDR